MAATFDKRTLPVVFTVGDSIPLSEGKCNMDMKIGKILSL